MDDGDDIFIVEEIINNINGIFIPQWFIAANPQIFAQMGPHHLDLDQDFIAQVGIPLLGGAGHPPNHWDVGFEAANAEALQFLLIIVDRIEVRVTQLADNITTIQEHLQRQFWPNRLNDVISGLSRLIRGLFLRCRAAINRL